MDSTTRENIFANKERLHQLTQGTGEDGRERRESQAVDRERARQKAKEIEEKRYLKKHNKTVTKVLNMAARASNKTRGSSEDEDEVEEQSDEDSDEDDQHEHLQTQDPQTHVRRNTADQDGEKGKEREDHSTSSRDKGEPSFKDFILRSLFWYLVYLGPVGRASGKRKRRLLKAPDKARVRSRDKQSEAAISAIYK